MSTPKHRLFQGFQPFLAICVTFITPIAAAVAANPMTPDGLPVAIAAGDPTLQLISPVDGLTLESYSPTGADNLLAKLRWGFSLEPANNRRIRAARDW